MNTLLSRSSVPGVGAAGPIPSAPPAEPGVTVPRVKDGKINQGPAPSGEPAPKSPRPAPTPTPMSTPASTPPDRARPVTVWDLRERAKAAKKARRASAEARSGQPPVGPRPRRKASARPEPAKAPEQREEELREDARRIEELKAAFRKETAAERERDRVARERTEKRWLRRVGVTGTVLAALAAMWAVFGTGRSGGPDPATPPPEKRPVTRPEPAGDGTLVVPLEATLQVSNPRPPSGGR